MQKEFEYIVAGVKPWNRRIFIEYRNRQIGSWHFCSNKDELKQKLEQPSSPRYIFFLHWPWKVPLSILRKYECICFHMTDVPYGRGGSPLQNLIVRDHKTTNLSALRMVEEFDAGPVYLKEDLCLEGNAEEIYIRATYLSFKMIEEIIEYQIEPVPQEGPSTVFGRRSPQDSEIRDLKNLGALHDFIRMLDAEGYPKAFINYNGYRFEFTRAGMYDGRIVADVTITPMEEDNR